MAEPTGWTSWSGLTRTVPALVCSPGDPEDVVAAVRAAREGGLRVKMAGSGHSFTDVALTDGLLLRPERLVGMTSVDRDAMTVTVRAGTTLRELNAGLDSLGLALHNLGDIDLQTVAGAISTGTHGSGGTRASLSAQVAALELVLGDGSLVEASPDRDPEVFEAARLGLGAVGVLTAVTLQVEPAFLLQATERPISWAEIVAELPGLVERHHHVDIHWFPHTERGLAKLHDRTLDDPDPLPRLRGYVEDHLLANRVFGLVNRVGDVAPRTVPTLNKLVTRALGARSYVDGSHRVLVSERLVRFKEMEYAVPLEAGVAALAEARRVIERDGWRTCFPVEIRATPADDVWLSTSTGRRSVHLAFHVDARSEHEGFFRAVEEVLVAHGGRPHWGKLHTRTAADLAPLYPRFADFLAVRRRADPDNAFGNPYLERVLGA